MAILLADNFSYLGRKPLDGRLIFDLTANMVGMADSVLYDGVIAYNQEESKYFFWLSTNTPDPTYAKWRECNIGAADGSAGVATYKQGGQYKAGTLMMHDGILYIVEQDFTADDTAADDAASFLLDAALDPPVFKSVSIDPSLFQPVAPEKHTVRLVQPGAGYAVGDLVATTDPKFFAEVVNVGPAGVIEEVKNAPDGTEAAVTTGSGAEIAIDPTWQVGYDGKWYDMPVSEGGADAKLTEDITSNVDVGGALAGTLFAKDTDFTTFAKMILRKTIIPAISFTATNTGVKEIGTTVNGSNLKLTINNIGQITVPINKVEFFVDGVSVDAPTVVDGQNVYTFNYPDPITTNTNLSVTLTYDTNKTQTKSDQIKFVHASYVGAVSNTSPTEAEVKALNKVVKDTKAFNWVNANLNDERFCYAYPASMGNLTSIKDANNFEYMTSYTKSTVSVDGENYNVYVLTDPVTITGAKQTYA